MDEHYIQDLLMEEYEKHVKNFGEARILGTFSTGIGNYGFAESEDELSFVTVYLPTFEELCFSKIKYKDEKDFAIHFIDIRTVYNILKNYNSLSLELLFCRNYYITPRYQNIFNEVFLKNRELLGRYNEKERAQKALNRAKKAFSEENYFEGMRLYYAADLFSNGTLCELCFHMTNPTFIDILWKSKRKEITPDTEEILAEMKNIMEEASDETNLEADTILKTGIVELISKGLKETISFDTFAECLSTKEKRIWEYIQSTIKHGEGYISVSVVAKELNINGSYFKTLFAKLEKNQLAQITNKGRKGTFIKMLE